MWKAAIAALLIVCPPAVLAGESPGALFSAEGYRIAHYRGPVAAPPPGIRRIDARALARLRAGTDAILIDVYPAEGGQREADGSWTSTMSRTTIPGAHWFPEAGRGVLEPEIARWFERGVRRLARGAWNRPIVVFCLADCWMSWNAARRLRALGYTDVRWFAEGTDGWRELGRPLAIATPEP